MKIIGKEKASLCIEKNGKPVLTICQLNWNQLLNNVIASKILDQLQTDANIEKFDTRYITINDMKISSKSTVSVKFQASLKSEIPGIKNNKFDATNTALVVKDFYNYIIELFEFYAYELDTDISNIQLELVKLEIVDGKPLTRLKICSASPKYFNDYIDIIRKYSTDDINFQKDNHGYFVDIYVESLDFLLQFVEDIKPLHPSHYGDYEGFIFTMIEKRYYCIVIYNGYVE